jgi:hypothetical protein
MLAVETVVDLLPLDRDPAVVLAAPAGILARSLAVGQVETPDLDLVVDLVGPEDLVETPVVLVVGLVGRIVFHPHIVGMSKTTALGMDIENQVRIRNRNFQIVNTIEFSFR